MQNTQNSLEFLKILKSKKLLDYLKNRLKTRTIPPRGENCYRLKS